MEIEFKKEHIPIVLLVIITVIYFYLAYNTPMLGEDEGAYFFTAQKFLGLKFPSFLSPTQPLNYPPLIPLLSVPFFAVLGSTLNIAKFIVALFGALTIFLIYSIGKKTSWLLGSMAAFLLLSIPLFTQFMLLYYVEVPIAFFSLLSLALFASMDSMKKAIFTGSILGLAFYAKFSAIFLPIALLAYAFYKYFFKKDKNYLKFSIVACIVFAVIIAPFIARNLILYGFPYVDVLNLFFKEPNFTPSWVKDAAKILSPSTDIISVFGFLALIFGLQGIAYFLVSKDEKLVLPSIVFVLFILLYYVRGMLNLGIAESRYFAIVFPQIALIGGYFADKVYEKNKNYLIILFAVIVLCLYLSFSVALGTFGSTRYPQNYLDALNWIKQNTPENANIFTAYGGSLEMFAGRSNVWAIEEFPQLMSTQDTNYIYNTLVKYNASYILIWRSIVAENYIVPESNLIGAFTYNFVNVVSNDIQNNNQTHFNIAYQNQDNMIIRLM
jgi:4-amino-4-deoxy-L-arabinose transferase-like glycosyltransferase